MNKLVDEAPYHPGYEDAVVPPKSAYKGVNPAEMLWKSKPLSEEEINKLYLQLGHRDWNWQIVFARAIEERHGIK